MSADRGPDGVEGQILELWEQADEAEQRVALEMLEQAIRLADEANLLQLQYQLRRDFIHVAYDTGDADRMLVAISWCLGTHDTRPGEFDDYEILTECQLALQYVSGFVSIGRKQVECLIEDVRRRYEAVDASPRSLLLNRCFNAFWMGDLDAASKYLTHMKASPRDDLYHPDWEYILEADCYRHVGDDASLLKLTNRLPNRLRFDMARGYVISYLLCPLLRAGRADEAAKLLSELKLADEARFVDNAAEQLVFLFATGDFDRGLSVLERLATPILGVPSDRDRFQFFAAASFCFARLAKQRETAPIRLPPGFPGHVDSSGKAAAARPVAASLADGCRAEAERLAEAFNRRNGNRHFSVWLERLDALHPCCEP
ncbi:MAG: hypothetical protein KDB14_05410 [Planctomycetales bacterium]|nr:hypothetical protein [Planctomycetales bacterium]